MRHLLRYLVSCENQCSAKRPDSGDVLGYSESGTETPSDTESIAMSSPSTRPHCQNSKSCDASCLRSLRRLKMLGYSVLLVPRRCVCLRGNAKLGRKFATWTAWNLVDRIRVILVKLDCAHLERMIRDSNFQTCLMTNSYGSDASFSATEPLDPCNNVSQKIEPIWATYSLYDFI